MHMEVPEMDSHQTGRLRLEKLVSSRDHRRKMWARESPIPATNAKRTAKSITSNAVHVTIEFDNDPSIFTSEHWIVLLELIMVRWHELCAFIVECPRRPLAKNVEIKNLGITHHDAITMLHGKYAIEKDRLWVGLGQHPAG
ncbi:hypothetical protein HAX54_035128 [Datura stramonium]|uniref:Uncharacterized protein n=1 Tax=Datura stramonium TaxID=4076 RepID=A0ABS8VHU4_DATST|nr:hypothetical protein [Datura stramonium]